MNMLKHLLEKNKGTVFHWIAVEFLAEDEITYDRDSFTKWYQILTAGQVFSTQRKIDEFMDSWTLQFGYPIVDAYRYGHIVRVTQSVCPVSKNTEKNQTFIVPINMVTERSAYREINFTAPMKWLIPPSDQTLFNISGVSKWFIINNQRTCYYRIRYDPWNYKLLRYELLRGDLNKISPVTRGQIIDDLMFLAKIGAQIMYDTALEMLEYLHRETHEIPWEMIDFELRQLANLLRFTPAYRKFKRFMLISTMRFYKAAVVGVERPSRIAIEWACFGGLENCKEYTSEAFKRIILEREGYEHLNLMICMGVKSSDKATFRYIKLALLNRLQTMDMELYYKALSCFDNYQQLKESLNMIFRFTSPLGEIMTSQDKVRVVTGMCENSAEGCQALLDFTFQHPKLVYKSMGSIKFKTVLSYLTKSVYNRKHERKLKFIIRYLNITDTDLIWQGMQSKKRWLQDNLTYVTRWLGEYLRDNVPEDFSRV